MLLPLVDKYREQEHHEIFVSQTSVNLFRCHLLRYLLLAQVVHSRTFGSAAQGGGVGVRMLLPLVDMFNHGGDEKGGTRLPSVATDSVRRAAAPPSILRSA